MAYKKKEIYAVVSSPAGDQLARWEQFSFQGFSDELNGGQGECVLKLALPFDYSGNDVQEGNDVQLRVVDGETLEGGLPDADGSMLIYGGYISLVERQVSGDGEAVIVHVLGYYTRLALDILKNGSQTTLYSKATDGLTTSSGSQNDADIGAMVRAILDRFAAENTRPHISYRGEEDVPDTGLTATYTFEQKTYRDAIDSMKDAAPPGTYWHCDENGILTFKPIDLTGEPDHVFVFGKHFSALNVQRSLEKVRNFFLIWNGENGGASDVYKHYQDDASIAAYGRRAQAMNDYGIGDTDAADAKGAKLLAENKDPAIKVTCTIIDNNGVEETDGNGDPARGYDIESIKPGQTCEFAGFGAGVSDILTGVLIITSVTYRLDSVDLEIELVKSGLQAQLTDQERKLGDIGSGGLGIKTTYS